MFLRNLAVGSVVLALAVLSRLDAAQASPFTHHLATLRIPLTISFVVLLVALIVVLTLLRKAPDSGGVRLMSVERDGPGDARRQAGDPFKNAMARATRWRRAAAGLAPRVSPAAPAPVAPPTPQRVHSVHRTGRSEEPLAVDQVAPVKDVRKPLKVDMGGPASPAPTFKPTKAAPPPPPAPPRLGAAPRVLAKGTIRGRSCCRKSPLTAKESSTTRLAKTPTGGAPPPARAGPGRVGTAASTSRPDASAASSAGWRVAGSPVAPVAAAPPAVMPRAGAPAAAPKAKDDNPWKSLLKKVKDDQTEAPAPPSSGYRGTWSPPATKVLPQGDTGLLRKPRPGNWSGAPTRTPPRRS